MQILLIFLFSFSTFAENDLHNSAKWLKLLHYKKDLFGRYVSEADSQGFFIHENGKTDSKAEFKKSIEVFGQTTRPQDDHPICKFPLRYKWLNQSLGFPWKADLSGCQKYISFFSKLAAKRASLVFSSYYLTNPNSAFGHTLLRLSRYDDRNETEMLDYGINYAAQARESNPFLYAVKGLFGGFIGEFAAIPYYYKIREYSDYEFRDLWSYDLKFSMSEVLEMVDHIWELGNTYFDYFYFHENCSYHLLSILEVARPSLELTTKYPLYTIPADTVRLLHQEGLIETGKKRESTYSRLNRFSEKLNNEELNQAKDIALHPEKTSFVLTGISDDRSAQILDVSMEAYDYFNFERILKDDPKAKEEKNFILRERAKNPVITTNEVPQEKFASDSPAFSHSPTRWILAQNYFDKSGTATRLEYRAALHDLLDPLPGTMKEAQLEIGKFSFELLRKNYRSNYFVLDQFSIFNIRNFQEQNFWSSPVSWEIDVGAKQLRRQSCFNCPAGFVNGSVGNSLNLWNNHLLMAFLINGEANLQSQFVNNYRAGIGPKFVTRLRFTEKAGALLNTWYHFNTYEHQKPFQDYEWWNDLEFRYHLSERFSLSVKGGGLERNREWQTFSELGLQYFYH